MYNLHYIRYLTKYMDRCTVTLGSEISAVWLTLQQWNLCEIAGQIRAWEIDDNGVTNNLRNANSNARL